MNRKDQKIMMGRNNQVVAGLYVDESTELPSELDQFVIAPYWLDHNGFKGTIIITTGQLSDSPAFAFKIVDGQARLIKWEGK